MSKAYDSVTYRPRWHQKYIDKTIRIEAMTYCLAQNQEYNQEPHVEVEILET
jgi:hypothetical protein